jgi:N-glycosylase/DNA lyase
MNPAEHLIEYADKRYIDLDVTLDCGQTFAWEKQPDGTWRGWIGDHPATLTQLAPQKLLIRTTATEHDTRTYFQTDQKWDTMIATFPKDDPALQAAIEFAGGMILLRQPLWETIASFILSPQKQIPHIRILTQRLRARFGNRILKAPASLRTFPSYKAIARASEVDLRACGLGFRAKSLAIAARQITAGKVSLDSIAVSDYSTARSALQSLRGVGPKVADCVALFALNHTQAFPMDTWILRMIREIYFPRKRILTRARMEAFASRHFGRHGGYAQQILFHWMRKQWSKIPPHARKAYISPR